MTRTRKATWILFVSLVTSNAWSVVAPVVGDPGVDWQQAVREANRAIGEQDLDRATRAYELALRITERFPEGDLRRASTLEQLASLTQRRGYPTEARTIYERALEERRRANRLVPSTFVALAALHERLGETDLAEALLREALAHGESADLLARLARLIARVRPEDPESLALLTRRLVIAAGFDARVELAAHQIANGDPEAAAGHFRAAIDEIRDDPSFPAGRRVQARLALVAALEALGRLDESEAELRGTLAAEEVRLGETHPQLVEVLRRLGLLLARSGRPDEAVATLERAIALREQAWGPCHACARQMREALIEALPRASTADPVCVAGAETAVIATPAAVDEEIDRLRARGEFAEARDLLLRVIAEVRKTTDDPSQLAERLERLARIQAARQDRRAAIEAATEALTLREGLAQRDAELEVSLWHSIGENALLLKDHDQAVLAYTREIALREESGELLRPAGLYETLSRVELDRSRPRAAAEAAVLAAEIWARAAGPQAPEVLRSRVAAARAFITAGNLDEAERLLEAAREDAGPDSSPVLEPAEAELASARGR